MPMKMPAIPRITTVGNMTRMRCTVSATMSGYSLSKPGATTLTTSGAKIIPRTVITPRTPVASTVTVKATCQASRRRSFSRRPENTGMKAADSAVSASRVRTRLGTLMATVKPPISAPRPR